MIKFIVGVVLGLAVAAMYPQQVASQFEKLRGIFVTANAGSTEAPQPSPREAEPTSPPAEKKGTGADTEKTTSTGKSDPALDYQAPAEQRAVNSAQWLELYSQIFKSQEGR